MMHRIINHLLPIQIQKVMVMEMVVIMVAETVAVLMVEAVPLPIRRFPSR
jgi:hypothetical protein